MNKQDTYLIEDYIDGKLKGASLAAFKARLKDDKPFTDEYNQRMQLAHLWIEADDYKNTRAQIANLIKQEKNSFFRTKGFYFLSIAASVILLIGLYFMLKDNISGTNPTGNQHAGLNDTNSAIVLKYEKQAKLATIDTVNNNVHLLYPVNGEVFHQNSNIFFRWNTETEINDTLYIIDNLTGMIVFKLTVHAQDSTFELMAHRLKEGNYKWYISDSTQQGKFFIIE